MFNIVILIESHLHGIRYLALATALPKTNKKGFLNINKQIHSDSENNSS